MSHIFISYSHKDTVYAHGLAKTLYDDGFEVWIDERLDYGSPEPNLDLGFYCVQDASP